MSGNRGSFIGDLSNQEDNRQRQQYRGEHAHQAHRQRGEGATFFAFLHGPRGADRPYQAYAIRTAGRVDTDVLDDMRAVWSRLVPGVPADIRILADDQAALYVTEQRLIAVLIGFSMFAIVVTLLGLLGLATYTTVRRTKEIGIRIVLGATRASIVRLIGTEVLVVALLSSAMALPLAWIAIQSFFGSYAYRIDISAWSVIMCILSSVLLACTTVGIRAWAASGASPAANLRTE